MRIGTTFPRALVLTLGVFLAGCGAGEPASEPEAETDEPQARAAAREESHDPEWGYGPDNGPQHWGDLDPEFTLCAEGTEQSPVDLTDATVTDLPEITFAYEPSALEIVNNGHTIQVNYEAGSHIAVDGARYELLQFHFHAPSEHTVDGELLPMEMHLVHGDDAGNLAVVGVLIEEGAADDAYASVWEHLPAEAGQEHRVADVMLDAGALLPDQRLSYRYPGSLTTPPCSEGVRWHVLTTPVSLSGAQIDAFTAIIDGNNRPVQPLNDRELLRDPEAD